MRFAAPTLREGVGVLFSLSALVGPWRILALAPIGGGDLYTDVFLAPPASIFWLSGVSASLRQVGVQVFVAAGAIAVAEFRMT